MKDLIKKALFFLYPLRVLKRAIVFLYDYSKYQEIHWGTTIRKPVLVTPQYIKMSKGVRIFPNARIEGVPRYNTKPFCPLIELKENVTIQQGIHLTCANHIEIGADTAIAAYVTITDVIHPYADINTPIEKQDIEVKDVIIGEGSKIYNGVVILPGVHIGNHVVVGANSVVSTDIPNYCVAVGSPARIVKRFNFETHQWEKTDNLGKFVQE